MVNSTNKNICTSSASFISVLIIFNVVIFTFSSCPSLRHPLHWKLFSVQAKLYHQLISQTCCRPFLTSRIYQQLIECSNLPPMRQACWAFDDQRVNELLVLPSHKHIWLFHWRVYFVHLGLCWHSAILWQLKCYHWDYCKNISGMLFYSEELFYHDKVEIKMLD